MLRAADAVLEHSVKSIELEDNEARVSELEPAATSKSGDRRFGPPALAITVEAARCLNYRGKEGVFHVTVKDELVASIEKPNVKQ